MRNMNKIPEGHFFAIANGSIVTISSPVLEELMDVAEILTRKWVCEETDWTFYRPDGALIKQESYT